MCYKARLAGLNVKYVYAGRISSLCPVCVGRVSPNGHRLMRCRGCVLEEDGGMVAVGDLLCGYQMDVGASPVHPENPPIDMRREGLAMEASARPERLRATRRIHVRNIF
jgi:putative transposase